MKIVIDANIPENKPGIDPAYEVEMFLRGKGNEIRKAFNGNEPAEFTGTTANGVQCNVMVITGEVINHVTGGQGNQLNKQQDEDGENNGVDLLERKHQRERERGARETV